MFRLWPAALILLIVSCGRPAVETDSFLIMELLQRRGLIYHYNVDQREQLRQEIESLLAN